MFEGRPSPPIVVPLPILQAAIAHATYKLWRLRRKEAKKEP